MLLLLNVVPISHLLLPLTVLPVSHLLLLLLDVLSISNPNLLLLLQLLYPKHQETEAKLDDERQNEKEKVNAPSDKSNTNQKKDCVPQGEDKAKKKKTNRPRNGNGTIKKNL